MEQEFACLERCVRAEITAELGIPQQGDVPGLGALKFGFSLQPCQGQSCQCQAGFLQSHCQGHLEHRVGV